ncbi:hypothetical protein [Thermomonospora umbrina]|uniref:Uncharacterized protein n=1 Tax=Thermomonospora umbrina TaxID=111806 RepID=A0A3D9T8B9_9ACTN|nr:hypothetical protein [Thermomonospora umbrina]REF00915.1 hypothetical protein DFJ69_6512 [Thermomonospora umbrina]
MRPSTGEIVTRTVLIALGIITATPALAIVWPGMLDVSYGVDDPADPMLSALLKHRGVLQGALGAALVWAALRPALRPAAAGAAIVTKSTFVALMFSLPESGWRDAAGGVLFDVVTMAVLVVVAVRHVRSAAPALATRGGS